MHEENLIWNWDHATFDVDFWSRIVFRRFNMLRAEFWNYFSVQVWHAK